MKRGFFLWAASTSALLCPASTTHAATVNISPSLDWFVEDSDGSPGFETRDTTSTTLKVAERFSRKARALLQFSFLNSGIPETAQITSATLNVYPAIIGFSSPHNSADIKIVGIEPIFGSPHLLPFADGVDIGVASFQTTGQLFSIPLSTAFLQENLEDDKLFLFRLQMQTSNMDVSVSSTRNTIAANHPFLQVVYQIPEPATAGLFLGLAFCCVLHRRS